MSFSFSMDPLEQASAIFPGCSVIQNATMVLSHEDNQVTIQTLRTASGHASIVLYNMLIEIQHHAPRTDPLRQFEALVLLFIEGGLRPIVPTLDEFLSAKIKDIPDPTDLSSARIGRRTYHSISDLDESYWSTRKATVHVSSDIANLLKQNVETNSWESRMNFIAESTKINLARAFENFDAEMLSLRATHETEMTKSRQELRDLQKTHDNEILAIRNEYEEEIRKLRDLEKSRGIEIQTYQAKNERELHALKTKHDTEIKDLNRNLGRDIHVAKQEICRLLDICGKRSAHIDTIQEKHKQEIAAMKQGYETDIETMERGYETHIETMKRDYETEIVNMNRNHEGHINTMKQRHETDVVKMKRDYETEIKSKHAACTEYVKSIHDEELSRLHAENANLKRRVASLETQVNSGEIEYVKLTHDGDLSRLHAENANLKTENARLKTECDVHNTLYQSTVTNLFEAINTLKSEKRQLVDEIATLRSTNVVMPHRINGADGTDDPELDEFDSMADTQVTHDTHTTNTN